MGYRRKRPPVCCTKLFVVKEIEFKIDSKVLVTTYRVGYFQKINKLPFVRPVPSIIYISGFKYLFAPSIVYNKVKYLYAITSNTFLFVGSITV